MLKKEKVGSKGDRKSKDYQSVLLEDMRDDIKLIAENLSGLHHKVDSFMYEMYGFKDEMYGFKGEMYSFRDEMYNFRDEMYSFRDQTNENFAFVAKKLLAIENELESVKQQLSQKADKNWVLEQLDRVQKELDELKEIARRLKTNEQSEALSR